MLLFGNLLTSLCAGRIENTGATKPNFLILFADDMGYGDISANGHPTILTPNIDRLAREGMMFTQWYSGFHVCSPSRAAMLTGRLPIRSGCAGDHWQGGVFMNNAIGGLPRNETTFAEALKEVGYASKAIGKWHLGQRHEYLPPSQGFDEYYGVPFSVDMGDTPWDNNTLLPLPLIHAVPAPNPDGTLNSSYTVIEQPTDLTKLSSRYLNEAISFIRKSTAQNKPWVLYFPFNHVHVPDFVEPGNCGISKRGLFGDATQELDQLIGKLFDTLPTIADEKNVLTFFTSDNGPWLVKAEKGGSAGVFRDGKSTTWEGGYREPGFVHWPGKITPGQRSTEVVATYDIFPTIIKLAGATLPTDRKLDGRDISDVFLNGGKSPHDCIFLWRGTSNATCPKHASTCDGLWAVRCGKYKAHWITRDYNEKQANYHDPPLVFHIERDPSELHPLLSDSAEYKNALLTIQTAKTAHVASIKPVPNQIGRGGSDDVEICADPDSQKKYPTLPRCTITPEAYNQAVCNSDAWSHDDL